MSARQFIEIGLFYRKLTTVIAVLEADTKIADELFQKNRQEQFFRRTIIRCVCAWAEGTLAVLKPGIPKIALVFNVPLSQRELEVATETRTKQIDGVDKTIPFWLPFPENLKATFRLFPKAHTVPFELDTQCTQYQLLCKTVDLRNKLMHPKNVFDLEVKDQALKDAHICLMWYQDTLKAMVRQCQRQVSVVTGTAFQE